MFSEFTYIDGKLFRNNKEVGWQQKNGYRMLSYRNKKYLTHRVIWYLHYGKWPAHNIDHINRDRLDNRIENLRDVSQSINTRNRANVRGCYWDGVAWRVTFSLHGKTHYMGRFHSKSSAIKEYTRAKQETDSGLPLSKPHVRTRATSAGL